MNLIVSSKAEAEAFRRDVSEIRGFFQKELKERHAEARRVGGFAAAWPMGTVPMPETELQQTEDESENDECDNPS